MENCYLFQLDESTAESVQMINSAATNYKPQDRLYSKDDGFSRCFNIWSFHILHIYNCK